jgi:catechol 2,3-dioxygenase-like lactoylglutathione lyase family enzyme
MIDHVTFVVRDYEKSKTFYVGALAPLGYSLLREYGKMGGFGIGTKPDFWISEKRASYWDAAHEPSRSPMHIAIAAPSRVAVDEFYAAAIKASGKDFGTPGVREAYHPNYYGAFIIDPDGNNIEAVCHTDP